MLDPRGDSLQSGLSTAQKECFSSTGPGNKSPPPRPDMDLPAGPHILGSLLASFQYRFPSHFSAHKTISHHALCLNILIFSIQKFLGCHMRANKCKWMICIVHLGKSKTVSPKALEHFKKNSIYAEACLCFLHNYLLIIPLHLRLLLLQQDFKFLTSN